MSVRVAGQAEAPRLLSSLCPSAACRKIPVSAPGVSKPGVTLAWKESELFHQNFWSSQGGFP